MSTSKSVQKSEWLISCDEIGVLGERYYGIGSLWINYQRRGDLNAAVTKLREKHHYTVEEPWATADSAAAIAFFQDIVEFFFKSQWTAFHTLIVRQDALHRSDASAFDLSRRRHFTMLLSSNMKRWVELYPEREHAFRVWANLPAASGVPRGETPVDVISEEMLQQRFHPPVPEIRFNNKADALSVAPIQLCHLLLGAVLDAFDPEAAADPLQQVIATYLGWPDLKAETFGSEKKFNIWYFQERLSGPRLIDTRGVQLKFKA